jgi:agmatinase
MDLPSIDDPQTAGACAAILGIPFDCGNHPYRIGSRLGPDAIRQQSLLIRPYRTGFENENPIESLGLLDAGNVDCRPGDVEITYPAIEGAVGALLSAGIAPITMGGDGTVTLPQLRALAKNNPDLVVLHLDSHTDAYPLEGYNTATSFSRAAEEGIVDTTHSYHVGARGNTFMPAALSHAVALGYQVVTHEQLRAEGTVPCMRRIAREIGERPVYLCFDMDVFDPSCAPGVCTPEWGGLLAEEGLNALRALTGLNFVAFDVNTVSPPHDTAGMTALLAATVMYECTALAAASARIGQSRRG